MGILLCMGQPAQSTGFGAILRTLREAKGLTQTELGGLAGLHRQAIAKLERSEREPQWPTVIALAKSLGVKVGEFLPAADPPAKKPARKKK
jgi:transcriptional regulator with XRE-family HTH domain